MVGMLPRSAWTSTPRPVPKLVANDPAQLRGFAVHYTGSAVPLGQTATLAQSASRLEAERVEHVDGRGYSDIAYLAAVDEAGRLFDARGALYRCAANGNQVVNTRYGAITVLVGVGDVPTPAAVDAVRWWRQNVWLPLYPRAVEVVGHRDLWSTDCPGRPLYDLVRSGAFITTPPILEDDMQLSELAGWDVSGLVGLPAGSLNFQTLIGRVYLGVAAQPSVDDIAAAVGRHLPPGGSVDAKVVAVAVADELSSRLVR